MAVEAVSGRIDVFLVAENRLLREALARMLNKKSDMRVVAAVPLTPQVAGQIAESRPQVLLLDSAAFAASGLNFVSSATKDVPALKVLMIGMSADDAETFLQCVRAGVAGYVLMDASAGEVTSAVRSAAQGVAVCPPHLCSVLFAYVARCSESSKQYGRVAAELTRREQQLVQMIGFGLSNKEIAAKLNISDQTVKNHVHHMLRKLGASDRTAAVKVCRQQGLFL